MVFVLLAAIAMILIREIVEKKDLPVEVTLTADWMFYQEGDTNQYSAGVPGVVHLDLLNNSLIPDPFYGSNEDSLQWIGEKTWVYQTRFALDSSVLKKENILLQFEGLDTWADVFLNDSLILQADNMFFEWEVEVKNLLKLQSNHLRIEFPPIENLIDSLQNNYATRLPDARGFVRKAPYHFGWDWGPRFLTAGVWRPVRLLAWDNARIRDVQICQDFVSADSAHLSARIAIESSVFGVAAIKLDVKGDPDKKVKKSFNLVPGENIVRLSFDIMKPRLWWPNGMGEQYLYDFNTSLYLEDDVLQDERNVVSGLRNVELVSKPDSIGRSFYFKVNGIPLFIKGANYIPQDNFLPRVGQKDYEQIVRMAADANMNMLRVWGGGVYEEELFYDYCDLHGILVWQDFMFACNMYPGDSSFLKNVEREARQNVLRLRNHPCIALWCGNNEVDEGWKNWGWQKQLGYSNEDSIRLGHAYHDIFDSILPSVVKRFDPGSDYWPSSPLYGWGRPESMTHGDSHYWGVWWGGEPFETYEEKVGRFMSEYGFQAFPDPKTLDSVLPEDQQFLYSSMLKTHQKHPRGFELIDAYMQRDFPLTEDFEYYGYVSQLLQAYGISKAIHAQRRSKPWCMGILFWQLNDCWPVVSWSCIDYYHRPKALYHQARRAYQKVLISFEDKTDSLNVFVVSDSLEDMQAVLKLNLIDFKGNTLWDSRKEIGIPANSNGIYYSMDPDTVMKDEQTDNAVLLVTLETEEKIISRNLHYFVKPKELDLSGAGIGIRSGWNGKGYDLELSSDVLVKGLYLHLDLEGKFSDNYFDLLPDRARNIVFRTDERIEHFAEQIKVRSLNDLLVEGGKQALVSRDP